MRRSPVLLALLASAAILVGGCHLFRPTSGVEWQGPDIHVVDGWTVGAETDCHPDREGCRAVIDEALRLAFEQRPTMRVTRAVWAEVPSATLWTPDGALHRKTGIGIDSFTFVILDLDDGSRWVIPQVCYLAYTGDGRLVRPVDCRDGTDPMAFWRTSG